MRVRNEIRKLTGDVAELTDTMNANQNNIYKSQQRLDALRTQMHWNQQELDAWLEKTRLVEEDAQALEKYARADDAKIKELTLHMERLVGEAARARKQLDLELTETHVNHIALDKASDNFRRIHEERQQLIGMWEQALAQMQQRDGDIQSAADEGARLRADALQARIALNEQLDFLKQEETANDDLEKQVAAVGAQSTALVCCITRCRAGRCQGQTGAEGLRGAAAAVQRRGAQSAQHALQDHCRSRREEGRCGAAGTMSCRPCISHALCRRPACRTSRNSCSGSKTRSVRPTTS